MAQARAAFGRIAALGSMALILTAGGFAITATSAAGVTPTTRYVSTTGSDTTGDVANDCTVKAKPCLTVQHAVDEANDGDTVSIGAGTFDGSVTAEGISLTITGSTSGTTTLTGSDSEPTLVINPGKDDSSTVTLDNLDISKNADAPGLIVEASVVTLSDSTVEHNADVGAFDIAGTLHVLDSAVSDNLGSGVELGEGATFSASGSTFSGNTAADPEDLEDDSFGVAVFGGAATIANSALSGNGTAGLYVDPEEDDAGISTNAPLPSTASVSVTDSTISDNTLTGVANGPGGTVNLTSSTVDGNAGADIYAADSLTTADNSTISGAKPAGTDREEELESDAGIVYFTEDDTPTARSAAASSLFASSGPAALVKSLPKSLRVTTVKPALVRPAATATGVQLTGSIVAQQSKLTDCATPITDGGYNLSSDATNSCGFSAANHSLSKVSANLGALGPNGGLTETRLPGTGSAALNAIPAGSAGCVAGAEDQRGIPRLDTTVGTCDIGAVQIAVPPLVIHPGSLPHGTVGKSYSVTFTATGGDNTKHVWSLASGSSLPAGLTLTSGGVLSGTPTTAGTFSVTVSVDDPVQKRYELIVAAASAATSSAAPASASTAPLANTGSPTLSLTGIGALGILGGFIVLFGAGFVGRRAGRHRR
jgi:large repetitive protein